MKKVFLVAGLVMASLVVSACEPGVLSPGAINARWTLTPNSCDSLHLKAIVARAVRDGETVAETTVPCSDAGAILLEGLDPAVYTVEIEGYNGEEEPRGTHIETQTNVSVLEGKTAQTPELRLVEKQSKVHVRWKFADGFGCVDNGVKSVTIGIFDHTNRALDQVSVACDVSFEDPDSGDVKSGVLFEGLTAAEDLIVIVDAYNADQEKILSATVGDLELLPGDTLDAVVTLE